MRPLHDLKDFVAFATLLQRDNHSFTSINQLSLRANVEETRVRRLLASFSQTLNDPLIQQNGRRLAMSDRLRKFLAPAIDLLAIGNETTTDDPCELVTVGVTEAVGDGLLTLALTEFLGEWGGLATVSVQRLDHEAIRDGIRAGSLNFGIGLADSQPAPEEQLKYGLPWRAMVPASHPLATTGSQLSMNQLAEAGRIFVPSRTTVSATLETLLARLSRNNRVEVPIHLMSALVSMELGIGLTTDACQFTREIEPFRLLEIEGMEPEHLGLYLPRRIETLADAVQAFVQAIRNAIKNHTPAASGHREVAGVCEVEPPQSLGGK